MPPTPDEAALVASLFSSGSPHKLGVLTGDAALELFRYTNLPPRILGEVWNLADNDRAGSLSPARTEVAVRLIGWAQAGVQLTPDLIDKPGPLASIPNISGNHAGPSRLSTIPPFAPEDRPKFQNVFLNGSPTNGLIEGERAREIFMKSKLAPEVLSQVWDLSDTQCRGALDSTDFAIAMHLIQGLMLNKLSVLPAALPNGLYEHVAGCPVNTPTSPTSPRVKPAVANEQDQTAAHSVIIEANEAAQNQTAASPKNHHGVNDNTPVGSSPPSSRWPPLEELSLDYQPTSPFEDPKHTDGDGFDAGLSLWGDGGEQGKNIAKDTKDSPPPRRPPVPQKPPKDKPLPRIETDVAANATLNAAQYQRQNLTPNQNLSPHAQAAGRQHRASSVAYPPLPPSPVPPSGSGSGSGSGGRDYASWSGSRDIARPPAGQLQRPMSMTANSMRASPTAGGFGGPSSSSANISRSPSSGNLMRTPYSGSNNHPRTASDGFARSPVLPPKVDPSGFLSPHPFNNGNGYPPSPVSPNRDSAFLPPQNNYNPVDAGLMRQVQDLQAQLAQMQRAHADKSAALAHAGRENESLRTLVHDLQVQAAAEDPASHKAVREVLARENEGLRETLGLLRESLAAVQASSSEVEMQRLEYEDLTRENERLTAQVAEMRESTTQLPWSGGDEELQTLINEDLARENARLRTECREMRESLEGLQEGAAAAEEQRRVNEGLATENERLTVVNRDLQARLDAKRREVGQLTREVDRLKTQLRAGAPAPAPGRGRGREADVPPPAYIEVDLTTIR